MAGIIASLRSKNPDTLREAALAERTKAAELRKQLKEIESKSEAFDFWGAAFDAGCNLGGVATVAGLRGAGVLTPERETAEPLAALALVFAGHRAESPELVHYGAGVASRWLSEQVEDRVGVMFEARRKAAAERATTTTKTPVGETVRTGA